MSMLGVVAEVGTYPIGQSEDYYVGASYSLAVDPPGNFNNEAVSGSITIEEATATRVRGSFSFVTGDGASVTNGRLEIAY